MNFLATINKNDSLNNNNNDKQISKLKDKFENLKSWHQRPLFNLNAYFYELNHKINRAYLIKQFKTFDLDVKNKILLNNSEINDKLNEIQTSLQKSADFNEQTKQELNTSINLIESLLLNNLNDLKSEPIVIQKISNLIYDTLFKIQQLLFNNTLIVFLSNYQNETSAGKLLIIKKCFLSIRNIQKLEENYRMFDEILNNEMVSFKLIQNLMLNYDDFNHICEVNMEKQKIKTLDFTLLNLNSISDDSFNGFNNLIDLDLSKNKIKHIDVKAFYRLNKLENLNLNHNELSELDSAVFYCLKNLKNLDLSHNKIKQIDKSLFYGLDKLKSINLSHNWLISISTDLINRINVDYSFNFIIDKNYLDLFFNMFSFKKK